MTGTRRSPARPLFGIFAILALTFFVAELAPPVVRAIGSGGLRINPIGWGILIGTPTGYFWLLYASVAPNAPQSDRALRWILAVGALAGGASLPLLNPAMNKLPHAWVFLSGIWILNGLGLDKIVRAVRRARRIANEE